jgi:two-component system NarL family sensor kinase
MHPPTLQSTRLRSSLRQYIEGYSRRSGINVDLRLGAKADTLPYEVQRTLLRIVQEGLANIHRHAAATRAAVQLSFIGGRLHLIIKDNGHGFGRATEAGFKFGRGLAGIDARARHYDGRLRIHGGPEGTTLHIWIPLTTTTAQVPTGPQSAECAQFSDNTEASAIHELESTIAQEREDFAWHAADEEAP